MRKPMSVGKSDFKEIIEQNSYFADKTLLVKEIIDKNSKVTLFARPRRFGKTLALHMLCYYFDIENAEKNKTLFKNLAISQAGENI